MQQSILNKYILNIAIDTFYLFNSVEFSQAMSLSLAYIKVDKHIFNEIVSKYEFHAKLMATMPYSVTTKETFAVHVHLTNLFKDFWDR